MSRHSKNNTARGHFTYAEMQMLDYGTKKQRLGRDSMRNFDACFLCLRQAREPVCCPQGHLACKECIYENILAQKLEIQRQNQLEEMGKEKEKLDQESKELLAHQVILKEFERNQMGVLAKQKSVKSYLNQTGGGGISDGSTKSVGGGASGGNGGSVGISTPISGSSTPTSTSTVTKRDRSQAFELNGDVLAQQSKQERIDIAKAMDIMSKQSSKPLLPSFWVPSLTPDDQQTSFKATKRQTMCTATSEEHKLSLKNLISVHFHMTTEDHDGSASASASTNNSSSSSSESKNSSAGCPVCLKSFTNTTELKISKNCGHVYCASCCKKFVEKEGKCHVCDQKCKKDKDIISMKGEGSGFSGGGAIEAKRFDVAFI